MLRESYSKEWLMSTFYFIKYEWNLNDASKSGYFSETNCQESYQKCVKCALCVKYYSKSVAEQNIILVVGQAFLTAILRGLFYIKYDRNCHQVCQKCVHSGYACHSQYSKNINIFLSNVNSEITKPIKKRNAEEIVSDMYNNLNETKSSGFYYFVCV